MAGVETGPTQDRPVGWILWVAGMTGVIAVTIQVLPQMLREAPELPVPLWAVYVLSLLQSGIILSVMILIGVKLGPACGLGAPLLGDREKWSPGFLPRALAPAAVAGIIAGVALAWTPALAPEGLSMLNEKVSLPLLSRVLYGGVTEELLVRWGVMSLFFWTLLRVFGRLRVPRTVLAGLSIAASALLFGLAHLPAVVQFGGRLTADVVIYIVGMNFASAHSTDGFSIAGESRTPSSRTRSLTRSPLASRRSRRRCRARRTYYLTSLPASASLGGVVTCSWLRRCSGQ